MNDPKDWDIEELRDVFANDEDHPSSQELILIAMRYAGMRGDAHIFYIVSTLESDDDDEYCVGGVLIRVKGEEVTLGYEGCPIGTSHDEDEAIKMLNEFKVPA